MVPEGQPISLEERDARSTRQSTGNTPAVEVSILVPSFNSSPYIVETIRSALDQSGVGLEVLVQDAGSTDGSLERLRSLGDPRLLVISEPDAGQSDALNRALRRATGEFVIWLNADDLLLPDALAVLLRRARDDDLDVIQGNFGIIDADGALIKSYTSEPLEAARLIRHGTYVFSGAILIRRTLLVKLGGFDPNLHYCMDYDLMLRLASSSSSRGGVPDEVARFRRQPSSKTESSWLSPLREWIIVGRRHGATPLESARNAAIFSAYNLLRPVWRSRLWLRIRPTKHLGASVSKRRLRE